MKRTILAASAAALLFAISCGKTYNPSVTPTDPAAGQYTLASAIATLAVVPKTVIIDAATGGTFNGNSGTRYVFPANSFKTAAGAVVTGNVTVEVSEFLKKSDMLFSGVLPISNGDPLLSGGEINVKATQGGQELQMASGAKFRANMPMRGTDATGMGLFTGTKAPNEPMVNWKPAVDTANGKIVVDGDTIAILSNTLNYANADRFMSAPNYQTFTITALAPGLTISDDSIIAHTFYDNYNGVWACRQASGGVFHESHIPSTPVHFVVFCVIKGNFYGGIAGATPANGKNYQVTLSKTTPAAFKAQMDAL